MTKERRLLSKRHIVDLKPYVQRNVTKPLLVPLAKSQIDKEPEIYIVRQLRARTRVNYKALGGYNCKNQKL